MDITNTFDDDTSFIGHIDDLYDSQISHSSDLYTEHLTDALNATSIDDLSFHVEHANEALNELRYFQDCKDQALLDHQLNEAHLESITNPSEIADAYQRELESILNPHASNVSFGSNVGNLYDRNALDFLNECQKHNIDLPSSVDHCNLKSETLVDRSVGGGFKPADKTIIRNTLDKYHKNSDLSDDDYNMLVNKLSHC